LFAAVLALQGCTFFNMSDTPLSLTNSNGTAGLSFMMVADNVFNQNQFPNMYLTVREPCAFPCCVVLSRSLRAACLLFGICGMSPIGPLVRCGAQGHAIEVTGNQCGPSPYPNYINCTDACSVSNNPGCKGI
jgi:hypothetical protein